MTEADYTAYFTRLLRHYGGSINAPSGWGGEGKVLYFSCHNPPIVVPIASTLTDEQRAVIVERARKQYGVD